LRSRLAANAFDQQITRAGDVERFERFSAVLLAMTIIALIVSFSR